jgi:hypothetical protein
LLILLRGFLFQPRRHGDLDILLGHSRDAQRGEVLQEQSITTRAHNASMKTVY